MAPRVVATSEVARPNSYLEWRGGEAVTLRSAKPLCEGSNPSRASSFSAGGVQETMTDVVLARRPGWAIEIEPAR